MKLSGQLTSAGGHASELLRQVAG